RGFPAPKTPLETAPASSGSSLKHLKTEDCPESPRPDSPPILPLAEREAMPIAKSPDARWHRNKKGDQGRGPEYSGNPKVRSEREFQCERQRCRNREHGNLIAKYRQPVQQKVRHPQESLRQHPSCNCPQQTNSDTKVGMQPQPQQPLAKDHHQR